MYNISSVTKSNSNYNLSCKSIIYIITFLFTLHLTPGVYVLSSFLGKYIKESNIGYLYAISSLITVFIFLIIRPILKKIGNYKVFISVLSINFLMLLILIIPGITTPVVITAFIINFIMHALAYFHLDIFLEHHSTNQETGVVRSAFLTAQNIAFMIGPIIAGLLLINQDYWKIFLFGLIFMIPTILITKNNLSEFKDPEYKQPEFIKTAIQVIKNKNIFNSIMTQSLLRVFYAWMIIYAPIFLSNHIGFSISEVAFIIGIALTAFIILEPPLGYVADKYFGEKEIMILGFLIMAFSTISMSFVDVKSFWLWVVIFFTTRIGASMVEIMSEAYFFKKTDGANLNMISIFRMIRPLTYVVFPALASLLLFFINIKFLFLILGILMLYGIKFSLALKDTL